MLSVRPGVIATGRLACNPPRDEWIEGWFEQEDDRDYHLPRRDASAAITAIAMSVSCLITPRRDRRPAGRPWATLSTLTWR